MSGLVLVAGEQLPLAWRLRLLCEALPGVLADIARWQEDLVARPVSRQELFMVSQRLLGCGEDVSLTGRRFARQVEEWPPDEVPPVPLVRKRVVLDEAHGCGRVIKLSEESLLAMSGVDCR